MNIVIVEDEHLTAERIESLVKEINPRSRVLSVMDSVEQAVQWFSKHHDLNLIFMDIQLADGISFDIFDQVDIQAPVIFITAYEEYAIQAFKVNSVDYLLKPVSREKLRQALEKYEKIYRQPTGIRPISPELLMRIREMIHKPFKNRFMVKVGEHIRSVHVENILYFFSQLKGTYLQTADGHKYVIDYTLETLEELVDPQRFLRINRSYIISHAAIRDLITLSASRIKIILKVSEDQDIYVSRERIKNFKSWLDQ